MADKPRVIGRGGEFLRIEPLRSEYAITSIVGRVDCLHVKAGSQLQINIEPENSDCMEHKRCSVWLKSPAWSFHKNHVIIEAFDDGGFWVAYIPNYEQYVDGNKMLIKYVFFNK